MTIGACSPPWSSSEMPSTFVDSASAGRNVVDSLFSASEYLPGRLKAFEPTNATIAIASTIHLAVRPDGMVRRRLTGLLGEDEGAVLPGYVRDGHGGWPYSALVGSARWSRLAHSAVRRARRRRRQPLPAPPSSASSSSGSVTGR